jgi:2-polyprenyl-6-methoxyphenol hydroxylase-like FAD-dependent oxidoreductase
MQIAIIGGGIGGMALALSLHAAGIEDVAIYAPTPSTPRAPRRHGAGTHPGAARCLYAAGVPGVG